MDYQHCPNYKDINVIGRSLWLMSNLTDHYRHWPANNVIGRIIVFVRNIYTQFISYVRVDSNE
jgi:hypothetical protein